MMLERSECFPQDCMLKHDNFKRANRNALIEHDKDNNSRRNYDEVAMQAKVKRVGDLHTWLHQQPPTPLLTWRILFVAVRLNLIMALRLKHSQAGTMNCKVFGCMILRDHPYITSVKGVGGWVRKMAIFEDIQR